MTGAGPVVLLTVWAAGAIVVGSYFFRLLPQSSESCAAALHSEDPSTRRQACMMVAFVAVMFGALWPIVVAFLAIAGRVKKK